MKKIRYLVFGLVFACLGLTSFTSAGSYTYTGSISKSISASSSTSNGNFLINFNLPLINQNSDTISNQIDSLNCNFSNFSYGDLVFSEIRIQYSNYLNQITNIGSLTFNGNGNYNFNIVSNSSQKLGSIMLLFMYNRPNNAINFSFDYSCTFSGNNIINQEDLSPCPTCPTCPTPTVQCDTTEKVSDAINNVILYTGTVSLNSSSYTNIFNYGSNGAGTYCVKLTSSSPQTLSFGFANGGTTAPTNLYSLYNDQYNNYVCLYGNKSYFNAKLNSSSNTVSYEVYKLTDLYNEDICINNEIVGNDCNTCESSLGACLEDNLSLENMNESLSSQLEACLLNGGNGCDPEVDTGCITGAFQVPLLSWSVGLDSFTTPIINNLTLPTNYKGKVVDGVLTISSINNNLSISDSDMDEIKNTIVGIAQYVFRLALILVIIYYIKFYLFNSKK